MRQSSSAVLLALYSILGGCIVHQRSLKMPDNSETTVALFTGGLGEPMDGIARHPWFAVRKKGEAEWTIYEVGGGGAKRREPATNEPYVDPILHGLWRGAEAERAAACFDTHGIAEQMKIERSYIFYPGPNSNTYGDVMLRKCKLAASLPSTAVGKDWRGLVGAGLATERTGVQVETPLVGLKVGLKEGIEVHVLGLSLGIDLWPPAIIVPVGPGRIGFADR